MAEIGKAPHSNVQVILSNSIQYHPFKFKLCSLMGYEGVLDDVKYARTDSSPFATIQIIQGGRKVLPNDIEIGPARRNPVKKDIFDFNITIDTQWMVNELMPDAVLVINFYIFVPFGDNKGMVPIGGTSIRLYSKHKILRTGFFTQQVWVNMEATNRPKHKPWKFLPYKYEIKPGKVSDSQDLRYYKLQKDIRRYHKGLVYTGYDTEWLDPPALTKLENELEEVRRMRPQNWYYAVIQLPEFRVDNRVYRVLFQENYEPPTEAHFVASEIFPRELVKMFDPDIGKPNLCEDKYHKMCRSSRTAAHARADKPNAEMQKILERYIAQPPTVQTTSEESTRIWSYRYWLAKHKRALVRFLRCVDWSVEDEAMQAEELMRQWDPIEPVDALALLSHEFSGRKPVRQYAVSRLRCASDEEILLYLLQLVQALRYEDDDVVRKVRPVRYTTSNLTTSLEPGRRLNSNGDGENGELAALLEEAATEDITEEKEDLATFLINRAVRNPIVANYLYWYLTVEATVENPVDPRTVEMYSFMLGRFSEALRTGHLDHRLCRTQLSSQNTLVRQLCEIMDRVAADNSNRRKKIELLRRLLKDGVGSSGSGGSGGGAAGSGGNATGPALHLPAFDQPFPLPLDPVHRVRGLDVDAAELFKSAKMPAKLIFKTVEDLDYVTIFKNGDDLRQDQLVVQLVQLVDRVLQQENLDLQLTPYKVLATSSKHGFMQFVESQTLQSIKNDYGSIHDFLRKHAPSAAGPFGIQKEVMDNYIRSCAGYCIITYLLGVGDRHLENLMLTKDGKLFHIDFGYICGRDPKLAPSPMRISSEMVDALGGSFTTDQFKDFLSFCFTAFLGLRKKANLLINLFSLMRDAGIPDIAVEPDKAVQKLQDRFFLNMSEEQAVSALTKLIEDSAGALMPAVTDKLHALVQFMRK